MSVKITRDKMADVVKAIQSLAQERVLVGIPAANAERRDAPINNAGIGYVQEFGSPANNIPPRPFLIPGVEAAQKDAVKHLKRGAERALDGQVDAGEKALHSAGLIAQNSVRATINEGIPPPLKPSTLAARRRRGRTGTKPLIDTGQLRNAITYVLRKVK